MKKRIPTLLATMIASALYSHQGLAADLASQCMLGVPSYDRPLVQGETNELPVTITADNAKGNYPDDAVFTGNVDIAQGNSRLQADEVQLHQKQAEGQPEPVRTVDALGNVHYDDNQVILKGPKGWSNLNTKDTNIWEGDYQMVGRQGRGKADLMKQRGENRYTILENGSFTSCLPGSNTGASSVAKSFTTVKNRSQRSGTPVLNWVRFRSFTVLIYSYPSAISVALVS